MSTVLQDLFHFGTLKKQKIVPSSELLRTLEGMELVIKL